MPLSRQRFTARSTCSRVMPFLTLPSIAGLPDSTPKLMVVHPAWCIAVKMRRDTVSTRAKDVHFTFSRRSMMASHTARQWCSLAGNKSSASDDIHLGAIAQDIDRTEGRVGTPQNRGDGWFERLDLREYLQCMVYGHGHRGRTDKIGPKISDCRFQPVTAERINDKVQYGDGDARFFKGSGQECQTQGGGGGFGNGVIGVEQ